MGVKDSEFHSMAKTWVYFAIEKADKLDIPLFGVFGHSTGMGDPQYERAMIISNLSDGSIIPLEQMPGRLGMKSLRLDLLC